MAKDKKIAIVGTASSSIGLAPYDDPTWEIWQINGCYNSKFRFDRHFDLHEFHVLKKVYQEDYFKFLKDNESKVWLNDPSEDFPKANNFPFEKVFTEFQTDYFTNTISWLTAFAIMQKPTHIGIWGVDMEADSEYRFQKPSLEHFLGLAKGRGIEIVLPNMSTLLKCSHMYGLEQAPAIFDRINYKLHEMTKKKNASADKLSNAEKEFDQLTGAVEILKWLKNNWG